MKTFYIIIFVLHIGIAFSFSQKQANSITEELSHTYITARVNGGLVIPHHSAMLYLIEDFSTGIELNYGKRVFNSNNWRAFFNYPEIGFGVKHSTFGNKDVYGEGYALFHYVNYSIYRSSKFSIQNKVAFGLGINTKPFNIKTNPYNDIIGSYLNAYIGLGMNMDYRISDRFSLSFSADLDHMSNGAVKRPNSGVNIINASIGTKYHFNTERNPIIKKVNAPKSNKQEILVVANAGRSQCAPFNTKLYWNGSININYLYHLNEKKAIGIGFDQLYSEAAPYAWGTYDNRYIAKPYAFDDYLFNAIFASYNVFLSKTTIFMNLGFYLSSGIKPPQPVYPRVGLRHELTKNLVASFGIKASFCRSEFLEFGLGYKFNISKKRQQ